MHSVKELLYSKSAIKDVTVAGWVRTVRDMKNIYFIELNDGSTVRNIQIVFEQDEDLLKKLETLTTASSIKVKGDLVESPKPEQKWEIKGKELTVYCITPAEEYPLQKKRHSFEFLRTIAHLRPRTNTFGSVFRVRSTIAYAIHDFFQKNGFFYIHTPIITTSDCEGAGQMFQVTTLNMEEVAKSGKLNYEEDFFGKKAYLTVSGQLEVENFAQALSKVYTFGPTFRAENSNTSRHLAEFWMIEPEMAFFELEDNMQLAESFIKYIVKFTLDRHTDEFEFFDKWVEQGLLKRLDNVLSSTFEKITYTQAIEILLKSNKKFDFPVSWGIDMQSEHERFLTEEYFKKPVFVTDYPFSIKAFYMKRNSDGKTVRAMDLLVPEIGEIIGGSQREDDLSMLLKNIEEKGLNKQDYWWYIDQRKYGSVPHSGFGLGFERTIQFITGMKNIRDVIPFFRVPGSAEF
ncbi:MAG: asparagine--tRNA ligase [Spirochaetales bacterium]|nr:asparagine--tRNA ligase [Spirochaetales bacterium]